MSSSPEKATAVALGEKVKAKTPSPKQTSVLVLNGNGVEGAAVSAGFILSQRGYRTTQPANGLRADAPSYDYFRTQVYFNPKVTGAKPAAKKLAALFGSADVGQAHPEDP